MVNRCFFSQNSLIIGFLKDKIEQTDMKIQ